MDWLLEHFTLTVVTWPDVLLRVGLAMLFGYIIGFDRNLKHKPIDYRVYMIVAISTCIIAVMGQELYGDYANADDVLSIDLGKIISGTLTGIGFLGAGAIIKFHDQGTVVGSATGASIWAAGAIGLCLGFGFYGLALIAFLSIAFILIVIGYFTAADKY